MLSLDQLNAAAPVAAAAWLDGTYEHSPWVVQQALTERPFRSLAHLKQALSRVVAQAGREAQLALVRAHPELAGKAMAGGALTAESSDEHVRSGLTHCTPAELARLR